MANQWFKFYGAEYLSDPKMDRLTVQERSCWLTLLCMASQSNGIVKYLSIEGLLTKSGVHFNPYDSSEWDKSQDVLRTFEQYEMIVIHKNGEVEIKNWDKRQEHNLTVAERVAKSRAKKKIVTMNVTSVTTEENRIEENRIESNSTVTQKKPLKTSFGEFEKVKLTDEEHQKLIEQVGEKNTTIMIAELDAYIASKGKKYSSHYATILNWIRRRFTEHEQQKIISKNKVKII